jgi:DNA-binding MarR family transcriptional regulator
MQAIGALPQASVQETSFGLGALMRHLMLHTGGDFLNEVERLDLSITQIKVLNLLGETGAPSLRELSDQLGLSLPGTSRAIDGLVKRGMVKRTGDPDDRRLKRLALTAKGRQVIKGLLEMRLAGLRAFVDGLEPAEREALHQGLQPLLRRPEMVAPLTTEVSA